MTGVETLSGILRLAAGAPWEGFESKKVLMDLYAARAALAQARAALEAVGEHEGMKSVAKHEKALFNKFGKGLPKILSGQEDKLNGFEDLALDYTKAVIRHQESLNHPDITETLEAHLNRRGEMFGDVAEAAMKDILNTVAQETMMVSRAVPKILDAMKASEESELMPETNEAAPHGTLIPAPEVPPAPVEWEPAEEEEMEEAEWEPGEEAEEVEVEWEPGEEAEEVEEVHWLPEDDGREEEIQEDAMAIMASDADMDGVEDDEETRETEPTSEFAILLDQIAPPMEEFFKKGTTRIEDGIKASRAALDDYEAALKGATQGRVASENADPDHGFNLSA